jgi:phenylalanyl-tRNA synthetase beta chain
MLISIDWIKDFVDLPAINPHDMANDFTMKTAEVEEIELSGEFLNKIKVAQIKSLKKHPEADKLNLVTIDFGGDALKEVVCGAVNVREGLKIPYAPLGTTLPGGFTLEPKKIRGILSEGMLCSETELDLGNGDEGLMEIPENAAVGLSMSEYLGVKSDTIIDVDNKSLTHRPDLWGMYGLAREFSAIYEKPLKDAFGSDWKVKLESNFTKDDSPIKPKVTAGTSCLAYWGLSVKNITVKESAPYIQERLKKVGLRPINNIVDISNYVMLELGIPLHMFDRDLIKDNTIHIKNIESDTTFTTLDEMERKLNSTDTVICDSEKPLVLAGIMGGANSGVNDSTTNIFIEVANWTANNVRLTSTRLGLRTDSSSRYEKSLDSTLCYRTLLRTLELVKESCPDAVVIGKPEFDGVAEDNAQTLVIKTSATKINAVLGTTISNDRIESILTSLDFSLEKNGEFLNVTVPSYRKTKDVEYEADIIEEVGRVIGYDNIESNSPMLAVQPVRLSPSKEIQRKIQDFMVLQAKSLEIMTYPLVGTKLLTKAQWPKMNDGLVLINALSKEAERMRPTMVASLLEAASKNTKNFDNFSMFELGRSYIEDDKNFSKENLQLGVVLFSKKENRFLELINQVEKLLTFLKVPFDFVEKTLTDAGKFKNEAIPADWEGNHPHEFLNVRIMGKLYGALTSVHPLMLRNFKIKGSMVMAIIDFSMVENRAPKSKSGYKPINKFPVVTFDCSVVCDADTPAENVLISLKKLKVKELADKRIVDVFTLEDGRKSVTLRTYFSDATKTLDSAFIKDAEEKVVSTLASAGFALKE